ncbi:helix-turn-helix domain-containing protein [Microvirga sp. 2TAF3]|uniref:helix-turn-helix domain-containing protein n=1 Tax=Microvirga sp. 2TAF3 TaxID=3233014 RepID=UPI003F96BE63
MLDTSNNYTSEFQDYSADPVNTSEIRRGDSHPGLFDKVEWLKDVYADKSLTTTAKAVVTKLALHHHNATTGQCNPSLETLGKGLGLDRRSIVPAIANLKEFGWITITKTGRSSNYRLNKVKITEGQRSGGNDGNYTSHPKGSGLPITEGKDTSHKHQNPSNTRKKLSFSGETEKSSPGRTKRATFTSLPDNWTLDKEKADIAAKAGLNRSMLETTHAAFVAHHRSKDTRNADWLAAWEAWCIEATRRETERKKQERTKRVAI